LTSLKAELQRSLKAELQLMLTPSPHADVEGPSLEAYLLGTVDYEACLALQDRLVYEASGRGDGQITLLLCEHLAIVTVGRRGSWGHIELDRRELASRQLTVRWVNHGGGCMVHLPGQLAVYPIVPLALHGFSLGEYLGRLQNGMVAALAELGVATQTREDDFGVWGRTGQLAAVAVAVRRGVAYHGAIVNVCPAMELFRHVRTDPVGGTPMSSLAAERQQPLKMTRVRETVLRHMIEALGCRRHHIHAGHTLWRQQTERRAESGERRAR
jgi:lipoyl(octanoyl) transferase